MQRLPVALVAVGLPATRQILRSADVSPGFAERLQPLTIGNLDPAATRDALATPFFDAGRSVDDEALEVLVVATHGYPYAIQLAGHACWQAAADRDVVTVEHARAARSVMRRALDVQIFGPRWQAMSSGDRQYVYVAAQLRDDHDTVATSAIARALGRAPEHLTRNRDRLINRHHALRPGDRGEVQFAIPGFADWILRYVEVKASGRDAASPAPDRHAPSTTAARVDVRACRQQVPLAITAEVTGTYATSPSGGPDAGAVEPLVHAAGAGGGARGRGLVARLRG